MDNQGTNQYLQPQNSPVANAGGAVPYYEFASQFDRNAINLTKIRNFRFDQAVGGTLTLGGTANGNGVMQVLNSSGGTIVTADNQGITINGGSITINDVSGSTIIDGFGVNSINQFPSDGFSNNSTHTTTSASYVDVPGSSFTITPSQTRNYLFNIFVAALAAGGGWIENGYGVDLQLYDNTAGTAVITGLYATGQAATHVFFPGPGTISVTERMSSQDVTFSDILSVSGGTHTYTLQYRVNGGGTAEIDTFIISYVGLGKG